MSTKRAILNSIKYAVLFFFLISSTGCRSSENLSTINEWSLFSSKPVWAVSIPGYQRFITKLFSITELLFNKEGNRELRMKVFGALSRQLSLNLLSTTDLQNVGISVQNRITAAGFKNGNFTLSIPISSPTKAEAYLTKHFKTFVLTQMKSSGSNIQTLSFKKASKQGLNCYLFQNRIVITTHATNKLKLFSKAREWSEAITQSYQTSPDNSFLFGLVTPGFFSNYKLPLNLQITRSSIFAVNAENKDFSVYCRSLKGVFDPFGQFVYRLFKQMNINPADLIGWMPPGAGASINCRPGDLLMLGFSLRLNRFWKRIVKPMIVKQLEKQIDKRVGKGIKGSLFKMFIPQKNIVENILNSLEISKKILSAQTGRSSLIINNIKSFQPGRNPLYQLEEISPLLIIEYKNSTAARNALNHLETIAPQLSRARIRITRTDRRIKGNDYPILSLSLYPWRIPGWLFVTTVNRFALLTPNIDNLEKFTGQFMNRYKVRGNVMRTFGKRQLQFMNKGWNRYQLYFSIAKLKYDLLSLFDYTTGRNIGPFISQFDKIYSAGLTVQARNKQLHTLLSLRLKKPLPQTRPLHSTHKVTDWLLYLSGGFILLCLLLSIVKTVQYRVKTRG